ncbi:pyridoxal phosphate-dependent aminotransferase [Streptomyces sp. W16]|uniref:pyridoxal phosphate-dependent aminotransferase n=1 Tax=Streptomyces sp. W16 TaxID=3076631 RepID=UPI00295B877B|nr:pyridoxal phosphate-dependent aminotransferase [Streptomyces sp. W16]MDV9170866.1 pyridoxal phosphate-dependent aminotransferase [Streptomyces sp. W16]
MGTRSAPVAASIGRSPTVALLDEVQRQRARGVDVLNLSGGEPDFTTPEHVIRAAGAALEAGFTHYTPSRGIPELCEAIAAKLHADNGIVAHPGTDIVVTPSAKHGMYIALAGVIGPGDEVLLPSPAWVSYAPMITLLGGRAVDVPLDPHDGFALTAERLSAAVTPRTRAILVNSPNNPTGRMLTAAEADAVAGVADQHDLMILADEIYEHIRYDGRTHRSLAAHPGCDGRTLTVNGFSKSYAMTGWRLGYVAGPAAVMREVVKVQEHTVGCAASFVQRGALAALSEESRGCVREMVASYDARRRLLVGALGKIPGVSCADPEGAFYVLPDISRLGFGSSQEFSAWLIERAGVVVTPGSVFGPTAEHHVRLSFAASPDILTAAVERLATALATRENP